jgi:Kdo2-lipid IVA lauroyltransferase/acyltransferase
MYYRVKPHPLKVFLNQVIGRIAVGGLWLMRLFDRRSVADTVGRLTRTVGPWLPVHRVGRANLRAAYPEKSAAEIERILGGLWDGLGRVAAEFAHLDRIKIDNPEQPGAADVTYDPAALIELERVRNGAKPTIFFAAHIGNWEIPALIPPLAGLECYVLYRPPNIGPINQAILGMRTSCMATLVATELDAPLRLANALKKGAHVGMLVDQHLTSGVDITFFGRKCKANPLVAHLARRFECPIRGIRAVRGRDRNTFVAEVTAPLDFPRDGDGKIDVQATMQAVNSIIEGWVREFPEQWLWLHRRWR